MRKNLVVLNESGIHARPAAILAKTAGQFASDITIEFQNKVINAKSIMNILSGCLQKGSEVTLTATGPDANEAVQALENLFNSKFGE